MRAPRQTKWLDDYLAVRLMGAGVAARRDLSRTLRRRRTPLRELMVLAVVHDLPRICPTSVADRLGLQRSELSRLLPELVEDGLLDWPAARLDGRGTSLALTPHAPRFLAQAKPGLEEVERRLRSRLTPTRRQQLAACLDQLRGPHSPIGERLRELGL